MRIHYSPQIERRIVTAALWLFVVCVIVIVLTSCSPYADTVAIATTTPSPTATGTPQALTLLQQWMSATPAPSIVDLIDGRMNYLGE